MEERPGKLLGGEGRSFRQKRRRAFAWRGDGAGLQHVQKGFWEHQRFCRGGSSAWGEWREVKPGAGGGQVLPGLVFLGRRLASIQQTLRSCRMMCSGGVIRRDRFWAADAACAGEGRPAEGQGWSQARLGGLRAGRGLGREVEGEWRGVWEAQAPGLESSSQMG